MPLFKTAEIDPLVQAHTQSSNALATFEDVVYDLEQANEIFASIEADARAEADRQLARADEAKAQSSKNAAVASRVRSLLDG